jgi:hypothetical protein
LRSSKNIDKFSEFARLQINLTGVQRSGVKHSVQISEVTQVAMHNEMSDRRPAVAITHSVCQFENNNSLSLRQSMFKFEYSITSSNRNIAHPASDGPRPPHAFDKLQSAGRELPAPTSN